MFSGGIDSPVACALAAKRFEVIPLYFCAYPHTSRETLDVTVDSLKRLRKITEFKKAVIYPWAEVMGAIGERLERKEFTCLICKKSMFRAAEFVCEREGAGGIVTGESLGQKASQTLSNMAAISSGIRSPILRPLLGLDKLEIERISKELGTWQAKHAGGCRFVPRYPRTRSNAWEIDELLDRLGLVEIIRKNLGGVKEIRTFGKSLGNLLEGLQRDLCRPLTR